MKRGVSRSYYYLLKGYYYLLKGQLLLNEGLLLPFEGFFYYLLHLKVIFNTMLGMSKSNAEPKEPHHVDLVMSPKALVVKSNKLVEARQRLSIQEQRIILLLISKIRPEDINFLWYKFQITDLAKFLGLEKSKRIYIDVRKAVRKLMKRVITIDRKGENIDLHWIESAAYGEKGYVKIRINQELKPYLLNLKTHFTKYYIGYVIHLRSTYSIRIYELLKRFENIGEIFFEVERLKHVLGVNVDDYTLYGNFKNKVILVAQKELHEKTDIAFTFEEAKEGKRVTGVRFFIKTNVPKQKVLPLPEPPTFVCEEPIEPEEHMAKANRRGKSPGISPEPPEEKGDTEESFNRLVSLLPPKFREMKSIQNVMQRALREYGYDFVARNINYTNVKSNAVKPGNNPARQANYGAYLSKALVGDFGLSFQENEDLKATEKALADRRREEEEEKKREEAKRQAKEAENRARAETILQALSEIELTELRKQAVERLPPDLQKSRFSSMMVKMEMQKIVLERVESYHVTESAKIMK